MDNHPISCYHLGHYFQVNGKQLQEQCKEHISDFGSWDQKAHACDWMLFAKNAGMKLSIDKTALSKDNCILLSPTKKLREEKVCLWPW